MRWSRRKALAPALLLLLGCEPESGVTGAPVASASKPEQVPSGIAPALPTSGTAPVVTSAPVAAPPPPKPRCPAEMVLVREQLCVDRWEATVVVDTSGATLSPFYPPEKGKAVFIEKIWRDKRGGGSSVERAMPLPPLPAWQKEAFEPRAVSKPGVIPQAYASGKDAERACKNAGKRLCTRDEWVTACRGEADRDFPYGDRYEAGKCNIFRETHPGVVLWEDPTINHTDPRFNLVPGERGPLLRVTGATPTCASRWGDDAILDMNGNVDEWIDDPEGTFLGGFYARGKKDGCRSAVASHVLTYADYSTGIRCCKDAAQR